MAIGFAVSVTKTVLDEVMLISPRFVPIDLPKCVQFSYKLSQKYNNEIRVLDSNGESVWSSVAVGKCPLSSLDFTLGVAGRRVGYCLPANLGRYDPSLKNILLKSNLNRNPYQRR